MEQLREFYAKTSKKSFLTMATCVLVACDVLVLSYIYIKFNNYAFFEKTVSMSLALNGLTIEHVGPEFIEHLYKLFYKTLVISIGLAALYHVINYVCWWKGKKFAATYIKMLACIGGPLMILWGFGQLNSGSNFGLIFILFGVSLLALYPGLKQHFSD
tara:strand:- start:17881 stop:18354 length:474 start_codon:yes stop_codon:yes gene_type:complete